MLALKRSKGWKQLTGANVVHKLKFMKSTQVNLSPEDAVSARIDNSLTSWFNLHNLLTDHREANMTQQQVADKLEITQPAVSVFENSNSLATQIGTLISYAAAIGLEIEFSVREASYDSLPEVTKQP